MTDLNELTKKELIALCKEHELSTDGNKAELKALLEAHLAAEHADEELVEEAVEETVEELDPEPVADPEPVVEEKTSSTPVEKRSARERVRIAWRLTQGGGHPPAMLWEQMTTDLALGRKTEAEIKAAFADL